MSRKSRLISIVAIITAVIASMASASGRTVTTVHAARAAHATDVVTIKFMGWDTPGPINAALAGFNAAHPTVHATFTQVPYAQYDARLNTMEVAGTQPDIVELEEYNVPLFGSKGVLYPMDGFLKQNNLGNDLLPSTLFHANGTTWGVGNGATTFALYYNKARFQKAGIAPPSADAAHPWTWAQYVAAAKRLTVDANGKHPGDQGFDSKRISVYGTNEPSFWLYNLGLVRSTGSGYFNKGATRFTLADKPAADAIQEIANLSLVDHVAPSPALMASFPSAATLLESGRMAMDIDGTWNLGFFGSTNFQVGIAAIPMFKTPQNTVWTAGYAISKNSAHPAESWAVLHSLLSAPTVYALGNQMPPFKSWFTDPNKIKLWTGNAAHPAGMLPRFRTSVMATVLNPAIGVQGENVYVKGFGKMMDNVVTPGLDPVYAGKTSAATALASITQQVQPLVGGAWK